MFLADNKCGVCTSGAPCVRVCVRTRRSQSAGERGGGERGKRSCPQLPAGNSVIVRGNWEGGEEEREFLTLVLARRQSVRGSRAGAHTHRVQCERHPPKLLHVWKVCVIPASEAPALQSEHQPASNISTCSPQQSFPETSADHLLLLQRKLQLWRSETVAAVLPLLLLKTLL